MPEAPLTLRLDEHALSRLDASGNRTHAVQAALEQIARNEIPAYRRPARKQISVRLPPDLVRRARICADAHDISLAEAVEAVLLDTTHEETTDDAG
ncbi:hypothetical protein [Streptomyces sp. NPDC058861]|uniref:hypothetical protein n=1 Tax=Streptomyces sp. NPDC058861 TaxID=3346653 RepID=UPI0036CA3E5A